MELYTYRPEHDRYWEECNPSHPFDYGVIIKRGSLPAAVNAFVTIYCGFDSRVWTYRKAWKLGDLDIVFVHDLDWQALAKLHGINMEPWVTGIIVNQRLA